MGRGVSASRTSFGGDIAAWTADRGTKPPSIERIRLRNVLGDFRAGRLLVIVLAVIIALLVVRPVAMSLIQYQRTASLLEQRRSDVAALRARQQQLRERNEYFKSDLFLAERARAYGLVRPGEQGFVVRDLAGDQTQRYSML